MILLSKIYILTLSIASLGTCFILPSLQRVNTPIKTHLSLYLDDGFIPNFGKDNNEYQKEKSKLREEEEKKKKDLDEFNDKAMERIKLEKKIAKFEQFLSKYMAQSSNKTDTSNTFLTDAATYQTELSILKDMAPFKDAKTTAKNLHFQTRKLLRKVKEFQSKIVRLNKREKGATKKANISHLRSLKLEIEELKLQHKAANYQHMISQYLAKQVQESQSKMMIENDIEEYFPEMFMPVNDTSLLSAMKKKKQENASEKKLATLKSIISKPKEEKMKMKKSIRKQIHNLREENIQEILNYLIEFTSTKESRKKEKATKFRIQWLTNQLFLRVKQILYIGKVRDIPQHTKEKIVKIYEQHRDNDNEESMIQNYFVKDIVLVMTVEKEKGSSKSQHNKWLEYLMRSIKGKHQYIPEDEIFGDCYADEGGYD